MEPVKITKAEILEAVRNPASYPAMSSVQPNSQHGLIPFDPAHEIATEGEISAVIHEVLMVKQLDISIEYRAILIAELSKLRVTRSRLRGMAESVKRRTTYGNIAFEHWIAGSVVTEEELVEERKSIQREDARRWRHFNDAVNAEIDRRISECRNAVSPEMQEADKKAMELVAWRDRCALYEKTRRAWYDAAFTRAKRRLAECKAKLRVMNRDSLTAVWNRAVERGDVANYDAAMLDHSHLFPDRLIGAMEDLSKSPSVTPAQS